MWIVVEDGLLKATYIDRPNRFIVNARLGDVNLRCHLPNPGRMTELLTKNCVIYVKLSVDPQRTTDATVFAIELGDEVIQLNSNFASTLIATLIENQKLEMFHNFTILRKEPKYGKHRFDLLLGSTLNDTTAVVELKSTTKVEQEVACFPDAISTRATQHVKLLIEISKTRPAKLLFCIYRDSKYFKSCDQIDPLFAKTFQLARKSKLEIIPLVFENRIRKSGSQRILEVRYVKQVPIL